MATNFQINDEDTVTLKNRQKTKRSGFAAALVRWGLAKTEGQANLYLVLFIIIGLGVIFYQNRHLF